MITIKDMLNTARECRPIVVNPQTEKDRHYATLEAHAEAIEQWMAMRLMRLRDALRKIEDITHCHEDWSDQDHMEMCERINLIAQKALMVD